MPTSLSSRYDSVNHALEDGFPYLRFEPELEAEFDSHRYQLLLTRLPIVAMYAIAMLLVYSISDYAFLPESVYIIAIAIRLGVIIPVLLLVVWVVYQNWSYKAFLGVVLLGYVVGGLGVVAIIAAGRFQGVSIPYEGVILITLFGYFLMGIPFYQVVFASLLIFSFYVACEVLAGLPLDVLAYNAFFLMTANFIGATGCYIHEKTYRKEFLNQLLVEFSRDQAEKENESKSRLLATASHDLRQPLHAMTLFADHLEREMGEPKQKELVHHLQLSIRHLSQLLGSVMDMSRLQFGIVKPELSNIDLVPFVEQVARESQYANRTAIEINASMKECFVYSDAMMLGRILRNLVENAMDHADANLIRVAVEQVDGVAIISVDDDGKGIPEAAREKIFEEFHQLENTERSGLGLGLSIVKQMSDLLGIAISLSSKEGQGTKFELTLPVVESRPVEPETLIEESMMQQSLCHVLMVEDAPEVLKMAAEMVRQWGYQVSCASSYQEAERYLTENTFDLVVTDLHLGEEKTGLDVLRLLRRSEQKVPAVLLTADTSVKVDEALQPVVVTFKPIKPAKLRVILTQLSV